MFYECKFVFSCWFKNFDFEVFNKMIILLNLFVDVSDFFLELLVDRYDNVLCDIMDILVLVKFWNIVFCLNVLWYNEDIGNEKRK